MIRIYDTSNGTHATAAGYRPSVPVSRPLLLISSAGRTATNDVSFLGDVAEVFASPWRTQRRLLFTSRRRSSSSAGPAVTAVVNGTKKFFTRK